MSQSIRICSGLVPIKHTSSSSCMFLSTEHTEVGFPILSMKECRKEAWITVVYNCNHPRFLPCAATLKSNGDLDDDKGKSLKFMLLGVFQTWWTIYSNFCSKLRYKVSKEVVVTMILMDLFDPIDGLKVLLDVSGSWRRILSLSDDLYDAKGFADYGKSYLRKARMEEGGTNKGKLRKVKNPPLKLTKLRLSIIRLLADLNDPNDGLKILSGALELWRTSFSSTELNDSEGYLQKEIFAIRDLSQRVRISVSNRNDKLDEAKHDEAENPPSKITRALELLKFVIDNFEDPSDAVKAIRESFRSRDETSGLARL